MLRDFSTMDLPISLRQRILKVGKMSCFLLDPDIFILKYIREMKALKVAISDSTQLKRKSKKKKKRKKNRRKAAAPQRNQIRRILKKMAVTLKRILLEPEGEH